MSEEIWKAIPGYANYEASTLGRIRRIPGKGSPFGRILKAGVSPNGYLSQGLCVDGKIKTITVHRLVAMTFLGQPPEGKSQVAHFDGNKKNNTLINLRWVSQEENVDDERRLDRYKPEHQRRLNVALVRELRDLVIRGYSTLSAARMLKVEAKTADRAIHGVTWKQVRCPDAIPRGVLQPTKVHHVKPVRNKMKSMTPDERREYFRQKAAEQYARLRKQRLEANTVALSATMNIATDGATERTTAQSMRCV